MANRISFKNWMHRCLDALHRHWQRRAMAVLLVLAVSVSLFAGNQPANAYIADFDKDVVHQDIYALVVETGATAGKQVEFFSVTYLDTNGISHTEYIFIRDGKAYPGDPQVQNLWTQAQLPAGNIYGNRQNLLYNNLAYRTFSGGAGGEILRANTSDTILFQSTKAMSRVTDISFFGTSNGVIAGQWSCRAMRLYKVTKPLGLSVSGYFSNQCYTDFKGELMAEAVLSNQRTFAWTADEMFGTQQPGSSKQPAYTINADFTPQEAAYDSTTQKEYFFEVAFDDSYGAGIETLINDTATTPLTSMGIYNAMVLEVQYTDIYNVQQKLPMPLILNTVNWALEKGLPRASVVNGIAQQGDTVGFAGRLPNCKRIDGYRLSYGYSVTRGETGIEAANPSELHQKRVELQQNQSKLDTALISHVAVYDMSKTPVSVKVENGGLEYVKTGDPICSHGRVQGLLQPGNAISGDLIPHVPGKRMDSKDYTNAYMVTVNTDDMASAGTKEDINIRFQYKDLDGNFHWTSQYVMRDLIREYYGQVTLEETDPLYRLALSPGNEANFIINLKDVAQFTGVAIAMGRAANDDWQMKDLSISKLNELGKRMVSMTPWQISDGIGNTFSGDRSVTREAATIPLASMKESIMLQPDQEITISLETNTVVTDEDGVVDWGDQRYEMTYEQAVKNLGLAKRRQTYQVVVKVADDASTDTSNGDCGSSNHFYFQLVFKNGSSGYVLANQQLSSDGFRAGYDESFTIAANQNYGELVSVNIIPDVETSKSQAYDKLKINSIQVNQSGTGGLSKQWVVNDVGWVAIDYREDGESLKTGTSAPRTEQDVVRSYMVNYSTYVVNLQFCVTTAAYPPRTATEAGLPSTEYQPQFEGAVQATINYYNGAGEYQSMSFDMVEAMYDYARKTPVVLPATTDRPKPFGDNAASDRNYMFRENTADRFIIGINDVSQLVSITLETRGQVATSWQIKSVTASIVEADGPLALNMYDEYQRKNTTKEVTSTKIAAESQAVPILALQKTYTTMRFEENEIKITGDELSGWESNVTRVPESVNDTLNVFLMPKGEGLTNKDYTVDCALQYANAYGAVNQTSLRRMTAKAGSAYLVATGLNATNMTNLRNVSLYAANQKILSNFMDYVVVQQVRSGVVIDTYIVNIDTSSTGLQRSYNFISKAGLPIRAQTVELKLGQDMESTALAKVGRDMALSIQYTSQLFGDNTILKSPNIFLTDQQYKMLSAGDTVRITFDQPYVKDIVSLSLATTGGLEIPVESALAGVFPVENGAQLACTSWTSFSDPLRVDGKGATVKGITAMSGDAVMQTLELTFADEKGAATQTSFPKNPVRMVVSYENTLNEIEIVTFDDIRTHQVATTNRAAAVTDAPLAPLKVSVQLPRLLKLRYIYFEPYDDDEANQAAWDVPWVFMRLTGPTGTVQKDFKINQQVVEGARTNLNIANMALRVTGVSYTPLGQNGLDYAEVHGNSGEMPSISLLSESGDPHLLNVAATNSKGGFVTKVELIQGSTATIVENLVQVAPSEVLFKTPKNETNQNQQYRVTLYLTEMPAVKVEVNITVLPAEKKVPVVPEETTPVQEAEPDAPPDSGATDTGQSPPADDTQQEPPPADTGQPTQG